MKFIPNYTFIYSSHSFNVWRCSWQRKLTNTGFQAHPLSSTSVSIFPFFLYFIFLNMLMLMICVCLLRAFIFYLLFFPPLYFISWRKKKWTKNGKKVWNHPRKWRRYCMINIYYTYIYLYRRNVHKTHEKW